MQECENKRIQRVIEMKENKQEKGEEREKQGDTAKK